MSKRKFADISGKSSISNEDQDQASGLQQRQIEGSLDQGKKALFRALKVARGFERQKLGRRQKNAKAENAEADITRLEAEVVALKASHPEPRIFNCFLI